MPATPRPRHHRPAPATRLAALLLAALPAAPAFADTWAAAVNGTFSDNTRWADGSAPAPADSAVFSPAGTYTVTFSNNPTTSSLSVSAGNVTFQSAGAARTHTVTGSANFSGASTNLTLAAPSTTLALNVAGSLASNLNAFYVYSGNDVSVGSSLSIASSSSGAVVVSGTGSTLTVAGTTTIALNGNAADLVFNPGAVGNLGAINIAVSSVASSSGTLLINNSTVNASGNIALSTNGLTNQNALIQLTLGSTLTQSGPSSLTIGSTNTTGGSEARVNIFGYGTLTTGTGPITVNPTGVVLMNDGIFNANGNLTINGGNFEANAGSDSQLILAPNASLSVQAGGDFYIDDLTTDSGSNVTVTGAGSTANIGDLNLGALSGSPSTLTISSGGAFTGSVSASATGVVNLNGGTLTSSGDLRVRGGSFSQTGGTFSLAATRSFLASAGAQVSFASAYNANNTTLALSSGADATLTSLNVGTALGNGAVTVTGSGSTLTAANTTTLAAAGFDGSLTLTANAAASLAGTLNVGTSGTNSDGALSVLSSSSLTTPATINLGGSTGNNTGTLTVSGPFSAVTQTGGNTNVGSPFGTSSLGSGTLNVLDGASFSTAGTLVLNATGTVNITDATASFASLTDFGGTLNFNSGSLTLGSDIVIGPAQTFGSSLTLGPTRNLTTQSSLQIDPASLLTLDGGTLTVAGSFANNGTFLFNSGRLNLPSLIVGSSPFPTPALTLGPGRTLAVTGALSLPAGHQLTVDGATLSAATLSNAGTLAHHTGALTFTGPSTNSAGAAIVIGPTATATFNSTLANSGEIFLNGALATLAGSNTLTNTGLIRGDGRIAKPLANPAAGELRAEPGKRLKLDTLLGQNAGKITLLGGTAEFASPLASTGTIAGQGTLIAPSLSNSGQIQLTTGHSHVFGTLTNNAGARTTISGNGSATFYNNVTNAPGSEFRVSAGSTATFFAPVTGSGLFTGTGAKYFESGSSAPASLATQGSTTVSELASLTTAYLHESSLTSHGPTALLPNSPASALATLDLSATGSLDITNNTLTVTATPATTIRQYLLANQLRSSTPDPTDTHSLGYLTTGLSTLVKLTLTGDANLDGRLDADDYALLDRGLLQGGAFWSQGDFNYDGAVTSADYLLIDTTLFRQSPSFAPAFLAHRESQFGPTYVQQLLTAIPEPSGLVCLFAVLPFLRRHRCRRR